MKAGYAWPNLCDDTGQFVAEGDGRPQHHGMVAPAVDLEVGSAGESGDDAHDDLTGSSPRCRYTLQSKVFFAVQYRRNHVRRHRFYFLIPLR